MKPLIVVVILMSFSFISATPAEDERADLVEISTWKDGIVPYQISPDYTATDKKIIMNGINAFAKYTCIKFVLRTSDHADYVLFSQHSSGICFSGRPPIDGDVNSRDETVGFLGGEHIVSLIKSQGCLRRFTVIHELMHLLGFEHQQTHENDSIMYYQPYKPTVDLGLINPDLPCKTYGGGITLSKWDATRINDLYNCPSNPAKATPPDFHSTATSDCIDEEDQDIY